MKTLRSILVVVLLMPLAGCSVDPLDGGNLTMRLQSDDTLVSVPTPGSYRITATNSSESRVEWGAGSSGCQLSLFVVGTSSTRLMAADQRACVEDYVIWSLDPGESRTETISWGGEVIRDGERERLPAGAYRLVATAGEKGESAPFDVRVAAIPE